MPARSQTPPPSGSVNKTLIISLLLGFLAIVTWRLFLPANRDKPRDNAAAQPNALPVFQSDSRPQAGQQKEARTADPNVARLAVELASSRLDPKNRRQAARELGRLGTDESVAVLRKALPDAPPYLKTAIGEALGQSTSSQARGLLLELVSGTDVASARGAIRGLAARGDAEAVEVLSNVIFNSQQTPGLRSDAALALADVNDPGALAALTRAARESGDSDVVGSALEALGQRPWAETESFFKEYLSNPNLSADAKVAAIDALGNSTGDVAELLMKFVSDPDPDVRSAALWGISATHTDADLGQQLTGLLKQESDAEVRMRLYEALAGQQNYDRNAVLPVLQQESDPAARLAGLALLGDWVRAVRDDALLGYFNQTAVPELSKTALSDGSPAARLTAVMTLRRGGTAEAGAALEVIAHQSTDPRVVQAANSALQAQKK